MEVNSEYFAQSVQSEYETYSHRREDGSGITTPSLSSPASTRITSISELMWKIFQLVDIDFARKKTFLALALTCKSFTGMALDLLWKNLDNFSPLIRCLPQSLWKIHKKELHFLRAMTFDDWSIFCKYNHRVRSLSSLKLAPYWVSTEIWGALGCPPFPLPLLPNLTSLDWNTPSGTFPYIRSFVTQKLTTLNIYAYYSEKEFGPSVQSILSCISKLCPSVSHFCFLNDRKSGDPSIALQCWSLLTTARTGEISDAAILHLSNLPSLRKLHITLRPTPIAADTQKLLQHPAFCALQELDVSCSSLLSLNAFFETLSIAPKMLSFYIYVGGDSERELLPASISRISNKCAHSALENLHVVVNETNADLNSSISAAAFQPLFVFHNLRNLDFQSACDVELDDATLVQIAKAWPLLEQLRIHGGNSSWSTDWHVTTNSLISLLQYCPHLTSVAIDIDWYAVDESDIAPEDFYQGFAHKALSRADFGSSRIRFSTGVAAFLSAIAPNLERIVGWNSDYHVDHPDYEEFNSRWNAVHQIVKAFSIVREQGRIMGFNEAINGNFSAGGEDSEGDNGRKSDIESRSSHDQLDFGNEEYEE